MARQTSRTYKLQLSGAGLACFIQCHARVATLAGALIPYGMTLFTALTILSRLDPADQMAAYQDLECRRLWGQDVHFVGAASTLRDLVEDIIGSLESGDIRTLKAKVSVIYVAALRACHEAESDTLQAAYLTMMDTARPKK
ncbi:hypothetical protein [Sphingomonas sp. 1185]|uniref:hypothetical protein n=1 Tax=Sphingomonas sp. 1185 TaxID=3156411 RepID=UPI003394D405